MLKKRVQERPRSAAGALLSELVGALHLPGNLPFADDHAVEAGCHAEKMTHRVGVLMAIEICPDIAGCELVYFGKVFNEQIRIGSYSRFNAGQVDLDAIARAENDGLAAVARAQFFQGLQ